MNTNNIISLVENSDNNQMQKNIMIGFINRAKEALDKKAADKTFIQELEGKYGKVNDVVISTEEVKIYTLQPEGADDDWSRKYPFRIIYTNKEGKWSRCSTVSATLDSAMLNYLAHRHLGPNSQFAELSGKMLGL